MKKGKRSGGVTGPGLPFRAAGDALAVIGGQNREKRLAFLPCDGVFTVPSSDFPGKDAADPSVTPLISNKIPVSDDNVITL